MPLTQLIRVQRSAAGSGCRANRGAFLSACQGANAGAGYRRAARRELVTMLLPESPAMTMAMTTDRLCGRNWSRRKGEY
jgi:hypothetical protein